MSKQMKKVNIRRINVFYKKKPTAPQGVSVKTY